LPLCSGSLRLVMGYSSLERAAPWCTRLRLRVCASAPGLGAGRWALPRPSGMQCAPPPWRAGEHPLPALRPGGGAQGADPGALDPELRTALHHAVLRGHAGVAEALLRAGGPALLFAKDMLCCTPVHLAAMQGRMQNQVPRRRARGQGCAGSWWVGSARRAGSAAARRRRPPGPSCPAPAMAAAVSRDAAEPCACARS